MFVIRFWGVRGSLPVPGASTLKFGGNTPCIEVRAGNETLIFDAGTGMRNLGQRLLGEMPLVARVFFSHFHWDHIQGFPFFAPAFVKGNRFDLFGAGKLSQTLAEVLAGQMNYPNFPVRLQDLAAQIHFHDLIEGEAVACGDAVVTNAQLNHPGGCFGYRVDFGGHAVTLATDTEHYACPDPKLVQLAEGSDVLIYDAMYTPEQYVGGPDRPAHTGWGHSTWEAGVAVAREARVRKLVLFHHDPGHDDETILRIESAAQRVFQETVAAFEGLTLNIA